MMLRRIGMIPRRAVAGTILIYQRTISPDHGALVRWAFPGGFCRYHPSCSEYGRQAVLMHGVLRGLAVGMWRVLRCNPWSTGGVDEIDRRPQTPDSRTRVSVDPPALGGEKKTRSKPQRRDNG